jgi:hypothetical protein
MAIPRDGHHEELLQRTSIMNMLVRAIANHNPDIAEEPSSTFGTSKLSLESMSTLVAVAVLRFASAEYQALLTTSSIWTTRDGHPALNLLVNFRNPLTFDLANLLLAHLETHDLYRHAIITLALMRIKL